MLRKLRTLIVKSYITVQFAAYRPAQKRRIQQSGKISTSLIILVSHLQTCAQHPEHPGMERVHKGIISLTYQRRKLFYSLYGVLRFGVQQNGRKYGKEGV